MELKPGSRWRSAVCETEAVLVRPPSAPATLECGGVAMIPYTQARDPDAEPHAGLAQGSLLGKRYADADTGAEVLCSKGGAGTLAIDGRVLAVREAKKLPSSD